MTDHSTIREAARTELAIRRAEVRSGGSEFVIVFRCRECSRMLCEMMEGGGAYVIKCSCNTYNLVKG